MRKLILFTSLLSISVLLLACGVEEPPSVLGDVGGVDSPPTDDAIDDPADANVREDTPVSTEPDIVVMTFNVGRLFDTECDSNACDGGFERVLSEAQVSFRVQQVADAIRDVDVDIALLQEVETLELLQAVVDELGDEWNVEIMGETGQTGKTTLDTAVIARNTRLLSTRNHRGTPIFRPDGTRTSFAREFLEVHLEYGTRRVIVFCAHFKSKNGDDPGRRDAEAIAARDIIREVAETRRNSVVILGGDLNDTPGSSTIDHLEEGDHFIRVATALPVDQQWTHEFGSQRNAIDHLYLATASSGAVTSGTVRVVRDASGAYGGSDHAALVAGFSFP